MMKYIAYFLFILHFALIADANEEKLVKIDQVDLNGVNKFAGWEINLGGANLTKSDLLPLLHHQKRPFYTPWRVHPPVEEGLLEKDLKAISRAIELKGYYQHKLKASWIKRKKDRAKLNVEAELESPFLVKSISVVISKGDSDKADLASDEIMALLALHEGKIFSEEAFQKCIDRLSEHFLNKGYYWVKIEPKVQASISTQNCSVRFKVMTGPICRLGEIRLKANSTIPEKLIRRELLVGPGHIFSPKGIIDSRRALVRTRWFRLVVMKVIDDTPEGSPTLPMILELEDAEHRTIQLGVGFGSEEGPRFKGSWTHRHFLKRGWKQSIENKLAKDNMSLKLGLDIPRAFRHEGHLRHEFEIGQEEEEDYEFDKTLISSRWSYGLSERQNIHFELRSKHLNHNPDASLSASLVNPPDQAFMAGPKVLLDRKWIKSTSSFQLNTHHAIGALFDIQDKKAGLWRTFHGYNLSFPLPFRWSFFHHSEAGWIGEVPGQKTPISERFYSGGSGSVRGYARRVLGPRNVSGDQLGGLALWEASVEFRHSIFVEELVYALFWDLGQLDLEAGGLQLSDFRTAWGMGLGYKMEIGLMRLDVGFPNARREWENPFQIHIDFGLGL
jgi:outer membrane protein insertion porin family